MIIPGPLPRREPGGFILDGWHAWLGTFTGVAVLTLAAVPVACLAVWVLARRRRAGAAPRRAWGTSLADVGIVYGTLPWVWVTMLPGPQAGTVEGAVSLVPFRDLATMSTGQVVGNLLVLAAAGFLVPMRFAALASLPRVVALAVATSILIESAQYVLQLDRVSSVDDVLLNAAGAGLAALASRPWWATDHRATVRPTAADPAANTEV